MGSLEINAGLFGVVFAIFFLTMAVVLYLLYQDRQGPPS